ncbi:hypothetical protein GGR51DRAFT_235617 [Nemania sp. FL0031]|nr:hypothetical protein GGR51DRAFT_235617 [Nemania sp. FL0031]
MASNGNVWRLGDPIPPAYDPCGNYCEEREHDLALRDPSSCYGTGTEEDPLVVWLDRPDYRDRAMIWAHNNFAKAIAKLLGFTNTWIIKRVDNKQYVPDTEGKKGLAGSCARYVLRETDTHITLRLGTGLYDCQLTAYAYVTVDEHGNPEKYNTEQMRRFRQDGGETRIEFRCWENKRPRTIPRRPVSLGSNWQIHANVGPYLDTYRPFDRRRRIPAMKWRDGNARRWYLKNDDFLEGPMTRDVEALVGRCHAAHFGYEAVHEKLAAMECAPSDRLIEFHLMREKIVTMQRDAYRESKGILL